MAKKATKGGLDFASDAPDMDADPKMGKKPSKLGKLPGKIGKKKTRGAGKRGMRG